MKAGVQVAPPGLYCPTYFIATKLSPLRGYRVTSVNNLVDQYKGQEDILFVSLASNAADELNKFLSKKKFNYAVVPNENKYMTQQLHALAYPTHILVGQDGKIRKVTNNITDLVPFIPSPTSPSKAS